MSKINKFDRLIKIMEKLLSKDGCIWDRKQTHKTLIKYLNEESAEFIRAVRKKDFKSMKEELGDLLLQIIFHSELARKEKKFDIYDVVDCLNSKLIRRHPHVFGKVKVKNVSDVIKNWEKIKKKEKRF